MAGEEQTTKPARGDHGEIERPDAKYPPHVKRWNVDGARVPLFPQQQLGNEVRAKKEKDGDPKFPHARDRTGLGGLVDIRHQAMSNEHQ